MLREWARIFLTIVGVLAGRLVLVTARKVLCECSNKQDVRPEIRLSEAA